MTRHEGKPLEPAIATEVAGALRCRAVAPFTPDASDKILCTDTDCVAALQALSHHDLDVIDGVLEQLDKQMHSALHYEERYSKKHGYKEGHYWLHRKIDQIIGMAIQDVEDHLDGTPHT